MTIIYLIRHSCTLKNNGIFNVQESEQITNEKIILSVEGEEQAKRISELDELEHIDGIWSSSYVRALETAKYIAYKNKLYINIDSSFNERKIGSLDDLKKLGVGRKYSFTEEQLVDNTLKNKFGENMEEVKTRMTTSINKLLCDYENKKLAIVSHGAAIKFYLMNFCNLNNNRQLVFNGNVLDFPSPCIIKLIFNKNELIDIKNIKFEVK